MRSILPWVLLLSLSSKLVVADSQFPFFHNVKELVEYWGYPIESHAITTEDGYILFVDRIPATNKTGKVIFLQHGLRGNAATFLYGPPDKVSEKKAGNNHRNFDEKRNIAPN
jgi:hypothetical protein